MQISAPSIEKWNYPLRDLLTGQHPYGPSLWFWQKAAVPSAPRWSRPAPSIRPAGSSVWTDTSEVQIHGNFALSLWCFRILWWNQLLCIVYKCAHRSSAVCLQQSTEMDHKGHFTLGRNGFPGFFEEQLPISVAMSASGVVGSGAPSKDALPWILCPVLWWCPCFAQGNTFSRF